MGAISHLLNRVGALTRNLPGPLTDGQAALVPTVLYAALPVRFYPLTTRKLDELEGDQMLATATHQGFCDGGVDITREDRLTVEGREYRVLLLRPPSDPSHHLEFYLEDIQRGG